MLKFCKLVAPVVMAALLTITGSVPGQAQAVRTWVSGVGDDANPCSRTAPCKTFGGTISKTAAHGEISVLDPGGFGAVTITKSISLVARGVEGSISGSLVNAIIINAQPTDDVTINGLSLVGGGNGLSGIRILSARSVHISNCLIQGFAGAGGAAINVIPSVEVTVFVSDCKLTQNQVGVQVDSTTTGQKATVFLDRVTIDNSGPGIRSMGPRSIVQVSNSALVGNDKGLVRGSSGQIVTLGNNSLANPSDGTFSSSLPLQ
jgi:hypothetical protein